MNYLIFFLMKNQSFRTNWRTGRCLALADKRKNNIVSHDQTIDRVIMSSTVDRNLGHKINNLLWLMATDQEKMVVRMAER